MGLHSSRRLQRPHLCQALLWLALALCALWSEHCSAETLCGSELVDTLQFVCGPDGFYVVRPSGHRGGQGRRGGGIVEECCFRSCSLMQLEQYCARPTRSAKRDLHARTHADFLTNPLTAHYVWSRKDSAAARIVSPHQQQQHRDDAQGKRSEGAADDVTHRPLMTLPSTP